MLPHASKDMVCYPACLAHVPFNLLFELLDAGEPLLLPYPPYKAHVHDAPVEVALEVDQVRLDAVLTPLERRRHANVGARRVRLLADVHKPSVNPTTRDLLGRIRQHIGRRETDGPPAPVPDFYLTPHDVGPPQKPRSLL